MVDEGPGGRPTHDVGEAALLLGAVWSFWPVGLRTALRWRREQRRAGRPTSRVVQVALAVSVVLAVSAPFVLVVAWRRLAG